MVNVIKSMSRIRKRRAEMASSVLEAPASSVYSPGGVIDYDRALKTLTNYTLDRRNPPPSLSFRRAVASLADLDDETTLDDVGPFRIICVYRLVREAARLKGVASPGVPLCDCFVPSSDFPNPMSARTALYPLDTLDELYRSRIMEIRDVVTAFAGCSALGNGMSFTPPNSSKIPEDWEKGDVDGDETEQKLAQRTYEDYVAAWFMAMELMATHLYLFDGSEEFPRMGELGLSGVFDEQISHIIWPSDSSLYAFEGNLLAEIIQAYQQVGDIGTRAHLKDKYGFIKHEIDELLNLAFIQNKAAQLSDQDAVLSREVLRLEGIIQRARIRGEVNQELAATKQLHRITGLDVTQSDAAMESYQDEMIQFMRNKRQEKSQETEED